MLVENPHYFHPKDSYYGEDEQALMDKWDDLFALGWVCPSDKIGH